MTRVSRSCLAPESSVRPGMALVGDAARGNWSNGCAGNARGLLQFGWRIPTGGTDPVLGALGYVLGT